MPVDTVQISKDMTERRRGPIIELLKSLKRIIRRGIGMVKRIILAGLDGTRIVYGSIAYNRTGETPSYAYQSMIRLFCLTGGRSNDFLSRCLRLVRPPYSIDTPTGVLTAHGQDEYSTGLERLRQKGYYVFPFTLADETCDELMRIGLTEKCTIAGREGEQIFDRNSPCAVKYTIPSTTLINNPTVQKLISDASIMAFAQAYLGSQPVLDYVNMWWITNINKTPDSNAAQLYHFDMDKIKWLKFFFYITDVAPENGPHCFVQRSHRTGMIPAALLKRGYTRIADEDARKHFSDDDFIEITGRRGTILAEDTRGLHKGLLLERGDRLMFELEFSNSLFGSIQSRPVLLKSHVPALDQMLSRYPRLYSHFDNRIGSVGRA